MIRWIYWKNRIETRKWALQGGKSRLWTTSFPYKLSIISRYIEIHRVTYIISIYESTSNNEIKLRKGRENLEFHCVKNGLIVDYTSSPLVFCLSRALFLDLAIVNCDFTCRRRKETIIENKSTRRNVLNSLEEDEKLYSKNGGQLFLLMVKFSLSFLFLVL